MLSFKAQEYAEFRTECPVHCSELDSIRQLAQSRAMRSILKLRNLIVTSLAGIQTRSGTGERRIREGVIAAEKSHQSIEGADGLQTKAR